MAIPPRKRPRRRMIVFRCPESLYQDIEPFFRETGGRSAYMVASLFAMITKLSKEKAVTPMPHAPAPSAEMRRTYNRFRQPPL